MRYGSILCLLVCISISVKAEDFENVSLVRVYDGDTIFVTISGLPHVFGKDIGIRLARVDTPEIRGKCEQEKERGRQAQEFVRALLSDAQRVDLRNVRRGKYFRVVAEVIADGVNVSDLLIEKNHAVPYDGKSKKYSWCT